MNIYFDVENKINTIMNFIVTTMNIIFKYYYEYNYHHCEKKMDGAKYYIHC